jgi:hypothetical protein
VRIFAARDLRAGARANTGHDQPVRILAPCVARQRTCDAVSGTGKRRHGAPCGLQRAVEARPGSMGIAHARRPLRIRAMVSAGVAMAPRPQPVANIGRGGRRLKRRTPIKAADAEQCGGRRTMRRTPIEVAATDGRPTRRLERIRGRGYRAGMQSSSSPSRTRTRLAQSQPAAVAAHAAGPSVRAGAGHAPRYAVRRRPRHHAGRRGYAARTARRRSTRGQVAAGPRGRQRHGARHRFDVDASCTRT